MLKKVFIILNIALLLLSSFNKELVVLSFTINRSYIAQNLCENKNNPNIPHCKGKCYLKKQLKKNSEENSKLPTKALEQYETLLYLLVYRINLQGEKQAAALISFITYYLLGKSQLYYATIFHPPILPYAA